MVVHNAHHLVHTPTAQHTVMHVHIFMAMGEQPAHLHAFKDMCALTGWHQVSACDMRKCNDMRPHTIGYVREDTSSTSDVLKWSSPAINHTESLFFHSLVFAPDINHNRTLWCLRELRCRRASVCGLACSVMHAADLSVASHIINILLIMWPTCCVVAGSIAAVLRASVVKCVAVRGNVETQFVFISRMKQNTII